MILILKLVFNKLPVGDIKMIRNILLLCSLLCLSSCVSGVKQSEVSFSKSGVNFFEISGAISIKITRDKSKTAVFNESDIDLFEKWYVSSLRNYFKSNDIAIVDDNESPDYYLTIKYSIKDEVSKAIYKRNQHLYGSNSLYKVESHILLENSDKKEILAVFLDNLTKYSKVEASQVVIEKLDALGIRVGELIGKMLLEIRSDPTTIEGEWINSNNNATLVIKSGAIARSEYESKSGIFVGIEDEIYSKGNTVVKLGEKEWLQILEKKQATGNSLKYFGYVKHTNPVNDDFFWNEATIEIIGNVMFIKHGRIADEESSIYFKSDK